MDSNQKEKVKELCQQIINDNADKFNQYQKGKKGLIGYFFGELLRRLKKTDIVPVAFLTEKDVMADESETRQLHAVLKELMEAPDTKAVVLIKPEYVAKLVTVILCTRVIVLKDASDEDICDKAKPNLHAILRENDLESNMDADGIKDDTECPYDEETDKDKV